MDSAADDLERMGTRKYLSMFPILAASLLMGGQESFLNPLGQGTTKFDRVEKKICKDCKTEFIPSSHNKTIRCDVCGRKRYSKQ